jgi:hypothetical protein
LFLVRHQNDLTDIYRVKIERHNFTMTFIDKHI